MYVAKWSRENKSTKFKNKPFMVHKSTKFKNMPFMFNKSEENTK